MNRRWSVYPQGRRIFSLISRAKEPGPTLQIRLGQAPAGVIVWIDRIDRCDSRD